MEDLYQCIENGNYIQLFHLLRDVGIDPNIPNEDGNTPLHLVAWKVRNLRVWEDNIQVARVLIFYGANVNQINNLGNSPLHLAVVRRNYEMIGTFLNVGAQIDLKDGVGNTVLHYAIHKCPLLQRVDPQYLCRNDNSCRDFRAVRQVLNDPISYSVINLENNLRETPSMWAVRTGDLPILKELTMRGAKQNFRDINGYTALHYAVDKQVVDVNIVDELMRHGSYPCMRNFRFYTPLDIFLRRLPFAPPTEIRKVEYLFKRFLLKRHLLTEFQVELIEDNGLRDVSFIRHEIFKMQRDIIEPRCSVHKIISQAYSGSSELDLEYCDYVLTRLLRGRYKIYGDIISPCFPHAYLSRKFAEICAWVEVNNERRPFLNFYMRFHIAFNYLSNFEMYNMMMAGRE